jgi:hypothetical protein
MLKDKWKALFAIDELLLLYYLIHLRSKKNTKEMDFEWCFYVSFFGPL